MLPDGRIAPIFFRPRRRFGILVGSNDVSGDASAAACIELSGLSGLDVADSH
jgi:hypothetical protein